MSDGMNSARAMINFGQICTAMGIPWTTIELEIEIRNTERGFWFDRITITQDGPISWLDMETLNKQVHKHGCEVIAINTQIQEA